MADNYAQSYFEPCIPTELITEDDRKVFEAIGVILQPADKEGAITYLYAEDWCTSGWIENEDGTETEVDEDTLIGCLQGIVQRSNGKVPYIYQETAYTCSKMRPGEFGGAAMFITANDVRYCSTQQWLQEQVASIESEVD